MKEVELSEKEFSVTVAALTAVAGMFADSGDPQMSKKCELLQTVIKKFITAATEFHQVH